MSVESTSSVEFYDTLWSRTRRLDQHHKCRMYAIEKILHQLPTPAGSRRQILELGCGTGMVSFLLSGYGDVTGLDQSAVGIETARASVPGRFVIGTLPEIAISESDFDLCVLSQVLEHFNHSDQEILLQGARERVRPRGHIIVTTPNAPVSERMRFQRGELQPIENWLTPSALSTLLSRTGWEVSSVRFAFSFFPILSSRFVWMRGLRYFTYDLLRLRRPIEDMMERRPVGDCTVVLATRL